MTARGRSAAAFLSTVVALLAITLPGTACAFAFPGEPLPSTSPVSVYLDSRITDGWAAVYAVPLAAGDSIVAGLQRPATDAALAVYPPGTTSFSAPVAIGGPGDSVNFDGTISYVAPTAGTYSLVVSNVISHGSVWLWWTTGPVVPVHRFYNVKTGTHFYTASEDERATVAATLGNLYRYEGVAYQLNTGNRTNDTPLHRFYNVKTGTHFYTASEDERRYVTASLSHVYRYDGIAYGVNVPSRAGPVWPSPPDPTPVHRFYNVKAGTHFYTASDTEKATVQATLGALYRYEGVGYYLAR